MTHTKVPIEIKECEFSEIMDLQVNFYKTRAEQTRNLGLSTSKESNLLTRMIVSEVKFRSENVVGIVLLKLPTKSFLDSTRVYRTHFSQMIPHSLDKDYRFLFCFYFCVSENINFPNILVGLID